MRRLFATAAVLCIAAALGIKKVPQFVVVGRDGEVVFTQIGFSAGDGKDMVDVIKGQL